ncbi:MAG: hypothetical protein IT373_35925 [Polyangiaceae bacterium]|nr:hypothetical protein [Polyangiaceae bacterium]
MDRRPRIDLDGVTLSAPAGAGGAGETLAVLRYRTLEGLVLAMPESADVRVGWGDLEAASLDLATGTVSLRFTAEFAARSHWLGGVRVLEGRWTDRMVLREGDGPPRGRA